MIRFSLARLQDSAPYELYYSEGDFTFTTDYGIHYSVSFSKESRLGDCDTYQLIIRKIEDKRSRCDPKVEATILSIVNEYFRSNPFVLLYICDTSDNREDARNRLFLYWFERNAEQGRFTIRTAQACIEDEEIYTAIIVETSNPRLAAIIKDFDDTAAILTNGK